MGANETGSQLKTSQAFNCFGSSWPESLSRYSANLQTITLHRWGIKCCFGNLGVINHPSSLSNYHKHSHRNITSSAGIILHEHVTASFRLDEHETPSSQPASSTGRRI